jgi:hypothetical protein
MLRASACGHRFHNQTQPYVAHGATGIASELAIFILAGLFLPVWHARCSQSPQLLSGVPCNSAVWHSLCFTFHDYRRLLLWNADHSAVVP